MKKKYRHSCIHTISGGSKFKVGGGGGGGANLYFCMKVVGRGNI